MIPSSLAQALAWAFLCLDQTTSIFRTAAAGEPLCRATATIPERSEVVDVEPRKWGRKPRSKRQLGGGAAAGPTTMPERSEGRRPPWWGRSPRSRTRQGAGMGLSKDTPLGGHDEPLADRWGRGGGGGLGYALAAMRKPHARPRSGALWGGSKDRGSAPRHRKVPLESDTQCG